VFPGDDFTMYLWDPTNNGNKPVARLLGHQNKVNQVQFSPDGTLIASAGWDNHTVRPPIHRFIHLNQETDFNDTEIVERQRWQVPQELKGSRRAGKSPSSRKHSPLLTSKRQVYQCAWSADSRLLVTGSKDCTLKVWNARNGNLAMDLPGHEDEVCTIAGNTRSSFKPANMNASGLCRGLGGRREDGRLGREGQGRADVEKLGVAHTNTGRTGADDTLPICTMQYKTSSYSTRCETPLPPELAVMVVKPALLPSIVGQTVELLAEGYRNPESRHRVSE
jgi:hypothetical protein